MKALLTGVAVAALMTASAAYATDIRGFQVTNLGKPECVEHNPAVSYVRGEFYSVLHGTYTDPNGHVFTDPFPWGDFVYAPYSGLSGSPGAPAVAKYTYATAQTEADIVWGSMDPRSDNTIEFVENGKTVGYLDGGQLTKHMHLPPYSSVHLGVQAPAGVVWHKVVVRATTNAFEYNLAGCAE